MAEAKKKLRIEQIKEKLCKQFEKSKWKVKKQTELIFGSRQTVTIEDIDGYLYKYAIFGVEREDEQTCVLFEKLDEAISHLDPEDMEIIKARYWRAESFEIIANNLGHLGDRNWAYRRLQHILEKIRALF